MPSLSDLVADLGSVPVGDRFEVGPAIFAVPPWTPDSEAALLREDWLESKERPGFRLVLDVSTAQEVLDVWSAWRAGAKPTLDEAVAAVLHYATHDAYLPVSADD